MHDYLELLHTLSIWSYFNHRKCVRYGIQWRFYAPGNTFWKKHILFGVVDLELTELDFFFRTNGTIIFARKPVVPCHSVIVAHIVYVIRPVNNVKCIFSRGFGSGVAELKSFGEAHGQRSFLIGVKSLWRFDGINDWKKSIDPMRSRSLIKPARSRRY